ncbi:MarR family winged helix-turn-helix transcriptional regulator [Methanobacterium formicicum]|uniref:Regulatory protein MarR n=1 Tax=Methanobacterium formicicum (strain DSM 3637 / PP1) TaxID=1204725 RepID=K2R108_METFP|nr:MarR family transcriptional regulator [Methanobacterium formicicum]EKF86223.1 regulatory protein MarR [Methanobacterium formicicum DSM 3637]
MKDSNEIKEEYRSERLEMEKYILIVLFLIQQRWGYIINKDLANDQITTKQWLMMIVMANAFQNPPSMQEVADAMSTTHQNVKQLATRLEARGFLKIEQDPENRRIHRLNVTAECFEYWDKRTPEDAESVTALFKGLDDIDIKNLFEIMGKLEKTSSELYRESKK